MKNKKLVFIAFVMVMLLSVFCVQSLAAENVAGDFNDDGRFNSADAVYLLNHYYEPDVYPITKTGIDVNGDGRFNSADAVYLLNHYYEPDVYPIGCSHELEYNEAVYATCTEDGNVEHWSCSKCSKNFSDENGENEIADVVVSASHEWVGVVSNGNGTHSATCSVCGEREDAEICSGGTATCTSKATCSVCMVEYGPEPAHSWGDGEVTTAAGCESTGVRTYTCSVCRETKTESIPATGHNYDSVVTAPGCVSSGYTTHTCSNCDDSYTDTPVSALGHEYGDQVATCVSGRSCQREGCVFTEVALSHEYELVNTVAATCTTAKKLVYSCKGTGCDAGYEVTEGDPLGHDYNNVAPVYKSVNAENCEFVSVYACNRCSAEKESEPFERHSYTASIVTEASCVSVGTKKYQCSNCAHSYTEDIPVNGSHDWDNGVLEGNKRTYSCKAEGCNETKTVIDASAEQNTTLNSNDLVGSGEVELKDASINLGAIADNIAGKDVNLSAGTLEGEELEAAKDSLSDDQLAQIGDNPIYNFTITDINNPDNNIGQFGDKFVTVTIPYVLGTGEDVDSIYIWFINDDGEVEAIKADYANGYVSFETNHFSYYTVTRLTPAQRCEKFGHQERILETVAVTCISDGYTLVRCIRCAETFKKDVVEADGHNLTTVDTPATCTEAGVHKVSCSDCDYKIEDITPASGHDYDVEETPATCAEAGLKVYTCHCGHSYEEKTPQLDHEYENSVILPTCDTVGYTIHQCKNCVHNYKDNQVAALGHDIECVFIWADNHKKATAAVSCKNGCDLSESAEVKADVKTIDGGCGNAVSVVYTVSYTYNGETFTDKYIEEGEKKEHNLKDKYTHNEHEHWIGCRGCGIKHELAAHEWDEGVIISEPTCTKHGRIKYTCYCGRSVTEKIEATGHVWEDANCVAPKTCKNCGETEGEIVGHNYVKNIVAPTCTEVGYTTYTCSGCGDNYIDNEVAALGHDYADATCTTPKTCTVCQAIEGAALGHKYESAVTVPTCTEKGYTTYTCSICEHSYTADEVAAAGHKYADATCTAPKTCTVCGATEGAALGHDYESVVTVPTCTEKGYTTYTCSICEHSYTADEVAAGHKYADATCTAPKTCMVCQAIEGAALGHKYESAVTVPTCTEKGYTTYTCSICEHSYTADEVAAAGHKYADATCTAPKTCSACGATEGAALGHKYADATCTAAKTCTVCKATEGEALGHKYESVVTAPTCTTDGYTTYTCSTCKDSYNDNVVKALGHKYADATCTAPKTCTVCQVTEGAALGHKWVDATCTEAKYCSVCKVTEGNAEGHDFAAATCIAPKTCKSCGITEGEALGHDWKPATTTAPKTCNTCGATEGDVHRHTWVAATCTTAKYCSTCNAVEGAAIGHKWVDATCTEARYCSVCKLVDGKELGHNYVPIVTAPTCTTDGYTTYTCSTCKDSYNDNVVKALGHDYADATCTAPKTCTVCQVTEGAALGHTYESVVTAPTCTADGYTTYTCSTCKDSYNDNVVKALGHKYADATCTAPKTCTVCKATEGAALAHNYEAAVTAPTCTEKGYTTYTCSRCGHSYVADEVKALDHNYVPVVTVPTCTEKGYTTYTCSRCGHSYVADELKALDHNYVLVVTAPTCTDVGYTTHTCSRCEESYTDSEIPALNHEFVYETIAPTCTADGKTVGDCTRCDATDVTVIPAEGHKYADATCTAPKTCTVCGATEGEALSHEYKSAVTPPNCVNKGYTTHTCSVCGDSYTDSFTEATGEHIYEDGFCTQCGRKEGECDHTELHDATIDFADYGICGGIVNYKTCECGEVVMVDPSFFEGNPPVDCDIETTKQEQTQDEYGNMYITIQGVCRDCGLIIDGEASMVYGPCIQTMTVSYTFTKDDVVILENVTASMTEVYHREGETVKIDLSELGACAGTLVITYCDCGEMAEVGEFDTDCDYEQNATSDEFVDENGAYHQTMTGVCSKCGLTVVMDQYTVVNGCVTENYYAAKITFGDKVLFDAVMDYEMDEAHEYEVTYQMEGETCEDGVRASYVCKKCDYAYTSYYSHHQIIEKERIDLSEYGVCGDNPYLILGECACGAEKGFEYRTSCNMIGMGAPGYSDDEGNVHYTNTSFCQNCGLRYVREHYSVREGCNSVNYNNIDIYVGETAVIEDYEYISYSTIHTYIYEYTFDGKTCDDGYNFVATCVYCGDSYSGSSFGHGHNLVAYYELSDFGACGGFIKVYSCACGELGFVNRSDGCSMTYENSSYTDDLGIQHNLETRTCKVCGLVVTRDYYSDKVGCERVTTNVYNYYIDGKLLFDSVTSKTVSTEHNYEYEYVLNGETCEDGVFMTATCSVCGDTVNDEYYDHRTHETRYDLLDYGACEGWIITYSCACGENQGLHNNIGCSLSWSDEIYFDDEGREHQLQNRVCEACGLVYTLDWYTVQDGCYVNSHYTVSVTCGDVVIVDNYKYVSTKDDHNYTYKFIMNGESCEDGYTVISTCSDCGYSYERYNEYHETFNTRYELSEYGACGGWISIYRCACGEYQGVNRNYHCSLDWSYERYFDDNDVEHQFEIGCCRNCDFEYLRDYYTLKDGCYLVCYNTESAYVGYTTIFEDYEYTSRSEQHSYTYEFDMYGESCEDGYTAKMTCEDCGYFNEFYRDYHEIFSNTYYFDDVDYCGGYVTETFCPCGYKGWIDEQLSCNFDYIGESFYLGKDGKDHRVEEYVCIDCGLERFIDESREKVESECRDRITYTYTYKMDGVTLADGISRFEYTESHNYKYSFKVPGGTCDRGYYYNAVCLDCGNMIKGNGYGHMYVDSRIYPTCSDYGISSGTCLVCSDVCIYDILDPTYDHEFEDGSCVNCGADESDVCDHELHEKIIDLEDYGCCGGWISAYTCSCGMVTEIDTTSNNGVVNCNIEIVREDIYGDERYRYGTMVGRCADCGLTMVVDIEMMYEECVVTNSGSASMVANNQVLFGNAIFETSYESHRTETREWIHLSDYTNCGGYIEIYECECGKDKRFYYDVCGEYNYYTYKDDNGVMHYVETRSCSDCGLEFASDSIIEYEGCNKIRICTYNLSINGECIVDNLVANDFETAHKYEYKFTLNDGVSCEGGYSYTATCVNCGDSFSGSEDNGYHNTYRYERYDLSELGMCGANNYIEYYTCACGQITESSINLNGRCEYEETVDSYTDDNGVYHSVRYIYCADCNSRVTYDSYRIYGACFDYEYQTSTVEIGGKVIQLPESHYLINEHHDYRYTFTLNGESCEDGYTYVAKCAHCESSYEGSNSWHSTYTIEKYDLSELGMCGEDSYIRYYSCACGRESGIGTHIYNGCIFSGEWEYYTDDDGVEHEVYYMYCETCNTRIIRDGYWDRGKCYDEMYIKYTVEIEDEIVVDLPYYHNGRNEHHDYEYEFVLNNNVSCVEGYSYVAKCKNCDASLNGSSYGHNTYRVARYDLSESGVCGGYIEIYSCACGYSAYSNRSFNCNGSWTNNEYIDDNGRTVYVEAFTCDDCDFRYQLSRYSLRDAETCTKVNYYTLMATVGDRFVANADYTSKEVSHDYEISAELFDGASSCDDGVIFTYTCRDCEYSYDNTHYYHYTYDKEIIDLDQFGSVCHGYAVIRGCACGYETSIDLSHALCDFEQVAIASWIDNSITGGWHSSTNGENSDYFYNSAFRYTCSVTDPEQCGLTIRYANYWLPAADEHGVAYEYKTWQFGYNEETGEVLYEATFKTGSKRQYHPYVVTDINETTEDGLTVTGTRGDCPECESYYYKKNYHDNESRITKREYKAENTLNNGYNKLCEITHEYNRFSCCDGYSTQYDSYYYSRRVYADGIEYWEKNERTYELCEFEIGEHGYKLYELQSNSNGNYYKYEHGYAHYILRDNEGNHHSSHTIPTYYYYENHNGYWEKRDYTYTNGDVCHRTVTYTDSNGQNDVYDETNHVWTNYVTVTPETCTQDGINGYECYACGEIYDTYTVTPLQHSWVKVDDNFYFCYVCGLENSNGASGEVVFEDLTEKYGDDENYVIGYYNRDNVDFIYYVSLILRNVSEEEGNEVILDFYDFVELEDPRAISFSKSAIAALAEELGYAEDEYDVRFTFVPVGADGSFDYAITLTDDERQEADLDNNVTDDDALVRFVGKGEWVTFTVTPEVDSVWSFTSISNADSWAELLDANGSWLTSDGDGGEGNQFLITYDLKAGESYQLRVRWFSHGTVEGYMRVIFTCAPVKRDEAGLEFTSNGDGTCYVSGRGTCTKTDIVIPETSPNGDVVTGIGDYAFFESDITSIVMPSTIITIGSNAFQDCDNLATVDLSDNTSYIGDYAFANCEMLVNIELPDSLVSLGQGAFSYCNALETIVIPENIEIIDWYAFNHCISLVNVEISEGVTHIYNSAFRHCTSLSSIIIPKSVISFGDEAFDYCWSLANVYYAGTEEEWMNISIGNYNGTITETITYFYSEAEPTTEGNFWHYVDGVSTVW